MALPDLQQDVPHLQQHNVAKHPVPVDEVPLAAAASAQRSERLHWSDRMLRSLAHSRVVNFATRQSVSGMKSEVTTALAEIHASVAERIAPHLGVGVDAAALVADLFQAAPTFAVQDSELNLLRASPAYVKPVRRPLGQSSKTGEQFFAYDNPLDKVLEAMFAAQPDTWQDVKQFSSKCLAAWQTSEAYDENRELSDTTDGVEFGRFIKRLKVRIGDKTLVFILYYDGLEVVNGLGQARTTHELACFYWALVDLNQTSRLNRSHLRLATVCYKRALSEVANGMEVVLNGLPGTVNNSWVSWMKRLDAGLSLQTPEGKHTFRGGTAIVAADTPAAAELAGTKKAVGPTTKSICRNCHCQQCGNPPAHRRPNSFLSMMQGWKRYCPGRQQVFRLRSTSDIQDYLRRMQEVLDGRSSFAQLEDWMQSMGVNAFLCAMWQCPHYSTLTGCPMDIMHIFFEGVARQNLAALVFFMCREWGVDIFEIVRCIQSYCTAKGLPRGDFPYVNATRAQHLTAGQEGGVPSSDCAFPGTALQVAHMVLHLNAMLGHLVPSAQKRSNVWQWALLTSRIGHLLWLRKFTAAQLVQLDESIWLHDTLLLQTPKLQHLWKPKNHYLSHVPLDILQWGPPRNYWCVAFEHENQLIKNGVSHGNFQNPLCDAAEHKALCVALEALALR